jgi:hypothetical protein
MLLWTFDGFIFILSTQGAQEKNANNTIIFDGDYISLVEFSQERIRIIAEENTFINLPIRSVCMYTND